MSGRRSARVPTGSTRAAPPGTGGVGRAALAWLASAALGLASIGLTGVGLAGVKPLPAAADTNPPDATLPATVSSDPLPTAQINGVVWSQVVVGDQVFVGGEFSRARPAGAAPGAQQVVRTNLMSYSVRTGVMTSFAPVLNGEVKHLAAFGDTVYAAGQFTSVSGSTRYRVAAFSATTGALLPFAPVVNGTVYGIAASASAVYIGGNFTSVNSTSRTGVAGFSLPSYALLPQFRPTPSGGNVRQLVISPDGAKVAVGGNFTTMNGSGNPGYGLALLNATTGASLAMPVNGLIRNGSTKAAILSMSGDASSFYGAGYAYSKAEGNLEGAFRADWNGNLTWVQDCHGDTYSVYAANNEVYVAGHPHYCGNVAGFPQTDPSWTFYRGLAFSKQARGTASKDPYGYYNYEGQPRPELLNWFPDINAGTYTGQSQGPWSVAGNSDYIVYGGEFTRVNNTAQQGLVRFSRTTTATHKDGPRLSGSSFMPSVTNFAQGIRISWPANHDRDHERLSYSLIKNNATSNPVYNVAVNSTFWKRPYVSYLDKSVTRGQPYTYRLRATDPKGNTVLGDPVTITAASGPSLSGYDEAALKDGPTAYWTLNDTSGTTATDLANGNHATRTSSVTPGVPGATGSGTGYRFPGNSGGRLSTTGTAKRAPQIFSIEVWFKTTTSSGGKIVGWGNSSTGSSGTFDRHLYLNNSGRLSWGIYPNSQKVITSPASYRDGAWHHAVANVSPAGQFLYVDGKLVASDTGVNHYGAQVSDGFWRIGGDNMGSWPNAGSSAYFSGDIDNVAIYPVALSAAQVQAHHAAGTGAPVNQPPVAAFTHSVSNLTASFNAGSSDDPDGTITGYAWNFGDGSTGSGATATATHTYTGTGTYNVTLTVTDDDGASDSVGHPVSVTVAPPPGGAEFVADRFDRTVSSGWGNADTGGAWSLSDSSGVSVASGTGRMILTPAGADRFASLPATTSDSTDLSMNFSMNKNASGGTTYVYVDGRRINATTTYRSLLRFSTSGSVSIALEALRGSASASTLASATTVGSVTPGTVVHLRMQAFGTSPTTVRAKVWFGSATEPASWAVTGTDAYAGLQTRGHVALKGYISSNANNAPVTLSVLDVTAKPVA